MGRWANKADQKFSQWCKYHGFGDMKPNARTASMWLATNWSTVTVDLDADITHPTNPIDDIPSD